MHDTVENAGSESSRLTLPRFTKLISKRQARWDRWRHNGVSWMTVPLRSFGRTAARGSFGVLMYHRVCPLPRHRFPPTYNVPPHQFGKQLDWLLKHGYKAWPLDRLVAAKSAGETVDEKVFAVTFDDGYLNNLTYALPILEELRVPATLFLATAYLDSEVPFPFDNWIDQPDASVPEEIWKPMTLQQCRQFQDSSLIELGCHTHTHADFRNNVEDLDQEIRQCNAILRREFGVESPPYAYPFGVSKIGFATKQMGEIARAAGCSSAFRIDNDVVTKDDDLYFMPRFDVACGDTGASIAGKLDGWSKRIRSVWRRVQSVRGKS
ncbi:Poly-beta-1,6-N-acetyl-D-glucosamine N-deacetylase precursor [Novipirellula galeiformis]|uniref:Poly-beta-1,6-N-acetyl-D-glucosamine N-deacetylase n=1 Tax=Novipirellula galeiformis TaxID=2528004 RepID=A0A5C6CKL9_9BACT|nr:polysaccharide deacetylase family protein [Novipirellula galeiformis]TWU24014.1 Poly-beta-1,6-N-acetyl-D-glucosamine N-deacetylase precursor [Novipirellula galeiformis]